jgi:stress response protein YsnF
LGRAAVGSRAEHVTISKNIVVYERAVIGRGRINEIAGVEADIRREQLRATTQGEVDVKGDLSNAACHDPSR